MGLLYDSQVHAFTLLFLLMLFTETCQALGQMRTSMGML